MDTWFTGAYVSPDMAFHLQPGTFYQSSGQNASLRTCNSGCRLYSMAYSSERISSDLEFITLPEASGDSYYMPLSPEWSDYLQGILQNLGYTEYVAYSLRDFASDSSGTYVDYCILIYDLKIEGERVVAGDYPCMVFWRPFGVSSYMLYEGYTSEVFVPVPAYGSFGSLSELRNGGGFLETYAILFAIGFAVVYSVAGRIFDNVVRRRKL